MRILSFILAFGILLGGSCMAGSVQGNLPGIGTFAYDGPPISSAPHAMVVAVRD